jgi:predicted RNA-binding Zn ribbon-like protein
VLAPTPAPGEDRSVALALVNTEIEPGGEPVDLLADARALARWLAQHELPRCAAATIGAGDLDRLRLLRGAIRASFTAAVNGGRPTKSQQTTLNQAAALTPRVGRLLWNANGPRVKWISSSESPSIDAALSLLAVDAIQVIVGSRGERLRACEAPGCTRMFLQDHGRRVWCSETCGNRARVARYYRKARSGSRL